MGNKQKQRHHRNGHRHMFYKRKKTRYINIIATDVLFVLLYTYRTNLSSLKRSNETQRNDDTTECRTSSQPQPSTPVAVEHKDSAECWIINLELLSKHIEDVTRRVATCSACLKLSKSTDAITIIGEKHRNGLASIMGCKFNGCRQEIKFATSTKTSGLSGKSYWTNNLAAVWGQMTVGGGFNSLQESLSVLGVPVMTKQSFIDTERTIGKWWWTALEQSMSAAGKEEKQIAIQQRHYHDGIPAITVIVDAGWCKRTHKHSYNALSGVGVTFGKETKKLLYIGVRNKFCSACEKGSNKEHECFRNWDGSSSSMESDIILEGFRMTEKQRANHAVKCYRSALENLVKDKPHYKGRHKLTEGQRKRLASAVRCAIIMRSNDVDTKKVEKRRAAFLLQEDILNSVYHCFGSHHKCKADYCKKLRSKQPSVPSPTKDAVGSPDAASSTDEHSSNGSPSSGTSGDLLSSSIQDTSSSCSTPDTTDTSFNRSNPDISSSSLNSSILDADASMPSTSTVATTDDLDEALSIVLQEQQKSWEDATADTQIYLADDDLDPPMPLDNQMICDIQKIASRLAAKSSQLLGMLSHELEHETVYLISILLQEILLQI